MSKINRGDALSFLEKIKKNDVIGVTKSLKNNPDLMGVSYASGGALHCAAENEAIEMIHFLMAQGWYVDQKSETGYTPLHVAVYYKKEQSVEALLRLGADPSQKNGMSQSPLYLASDMNAASCAEHLIRHGADLKEINVGDWKPNAPLHQAARLGHAEMVSLLISAGVDPNLKDAYHKNALHHALHYPAYVRNNEASILKTIDVLVKNGTRWDEDIYLELLKSYELGRRVASPFNEACDAGFPKIAGYFIDQEQSVPRKVLLLDFAIANAHSRGQRENIEEYQGRRLAIQEHAELHQLVDSVFSPSDSVSGPEKGKGAESPGSKRGHKKSLSRRL